MPAVVVLVADCNQDARGFPRFEDYNDLIGFGTPEGCHEFIAPTIGAPHLSERSFTQLWKRSAMPRKQIAAHRIQLAVAAKKPDHPLRLLKRLDQSIEQDAVKATLAEAMLF